MKRQTAATMCYDAVCRALQQHVDMLNGRLADSSLQIEHLKGEVARLHSEKQLDIGTRQTAATLETDVADPDMRPHDDDVLKDDNNLRAKASRQPHMSCSVYAHCQPHLP